MKILFVCLGNICRSPIAEGIMKDLVKKNNLDWKIDSAGIESYHVGQCPDRRAINLCRKHGLDISTQRARRVSKKDFEEFDHIYALADDILHELKGSYVSPSGKKSLQLLMDELYPGENRSVPDPWYGGDKDFEPVFQMIREACEAIVNRYS
jgi:protein-tyrosine phosphatase